MKGKNLYHGGKKVQQRNISEAKNPIETVIEIKTTGTNSVALIGTAVMPLMEIVVLVAEIMIRMTAIATRVVTGIMMPATEMVMIVGGTDPMETEAMSVIETVTETPDVMLAVTVTATLAATVMEVVTATTPAEVIGMSTAMVVTVREADAMVAVTMVVVFQQHLHGQQPPQHNK